MSTRKLSAFPLLLALTVLCLWGASSALAAGYNDSLEIRTANSSVPTGSEDVVGGFLRTASGQPIQGGKVTIAYAYPGGHWQPLTTFETSGRGTYFDRYVIPGTVFFRAEFSGSKIFTRETTGAVKVVGVHSLPVNGSEYVDPKNGCAYVVESHVWVGKYCESQQVDSSGNRIPDLYDLYEFNAASTNHVGNYLMEEYTGDPQYNEFRIPNNIVFQTVSWAAYPKSGVATSPIWDVELGGQPRWLSTTELTQLLNAQGAAAAGLQASPPANDTVAVPAGIGFSDLVNGIDTLGGNAALGEAASSVYSLGISEPFDATACGEYGYHCFP